MKTERRKKEQKQEGKKTRTQGSQAAHWASGGENEAMQIFEKWGEFQCQRVVVGVQRNSGGGDDWSIAQIYVPPPCLSLLTDCTFFVSLMHKSELSAVLNKNICAILSSIESQWFAPKTCCLLALREAWQGHSKNSNSWMSPERYACYIITVKNYRIYILLETSVHRAVYT